MYIYCKLIDKHTFLIHQLIIIEIQNPKTPFSVVVLLITNPKNFFFFFELVYSSVHHHLLCFSIGLE